MIKKGSWQYYAIKTTILESRMPTEMSKCELIRRTYFCWMYWPLWFLLLFFIVFAVIGVGLMQVVMFLDKHIFTPMNIWLNRVMTCPLGKVEIEQ